MRLTVTHEDFPLESKVLPAVSKGWPAILSNLKTLLETGQPLDVHKNALESGLPRCAYQKHGHKQKPPGKTRLEKEPSHETDCVKKQIQSKSHRTPGRTQIPEPGFTI